ncbi:ATP-dependent helicase/nuclease subunit A [Candidatus Kryptobacter tengchongensis]|nr:ATP-dependent helicase/nuclease subunit A [Candidatus Kryptobacter tengchongensis]
MRLTESQEKVIKSPKHLSVTAGAGSGKTTVLIEKYIKILEDLVESRVGKGISVEDLSDIVESIVVITFTEKAGSELRERATEAIERRIKEAREKNDIKMLKVFEELRDAMPSAVIGTIHSFCARILREFAVTAGVDPNFTILEGAERDQVIDIIIEDKIKEFLKRESEEAEQLFGIIERMRINNFYRFIKKLISSRELVEKVKRDIYLAKSDDEIIDMWRDKIFEYVLRVFEGSKMANALRSLSGHIFEGDVEFRNRANEFDEAIKNEDVKSAYRIFINVFFNIFTKKNEPRKEGVLEPLSKKSVEVQREIWKVLEVIKRVYNDIKDLQLDKFDEFKEFHRQYIKDTRLIISLYDEINREYENFKIQNGYLDFEDLQLKVRELLEKSEDVRSELSRRFRYIMIDEYQDTNYLQYEIVKRLIRDFSEKIKLFVVGDDKQSIYGFRGSDVEVFDKTRFEIRGREDGEEIYLGESFRLLKGIAGFVNHVFGKIMSERISVHEVEYKEIVVGRDVDDDGVVEMLVVKKSKDEKIRDYKIVEAEFVAKRILRLLQDENAYVYKDGEKKRIEAGDIAVLIRNREVLKPLESAFVELNIPYIVSSGIGFYQTQEIYDFMNYFKFIVNTNDDVALVGILRSPFFGISDSEIFRISVYGRGSTFWEKVNDYVERAGEPMPSDRLKRAVEILTEDLIVANRMSIPSLIQRIIENTMYNGSVLPMRRGEQMIANIQKLIDIAREFETKGLNNLYDFVEQLRFLSEVHLREGQASVQAGIDAVQIMTIHSAKGLEFPVVVLPFLGEKVSVRSNERYNIDVDYGIGLGLKENESDSKEVELPIDSVHKLIRQHKTIAEEKRVLYVAMTRARDVLIVSGTYGDKNEETYLDWVLGALEVRDKIDYIPEVEIPTEITFKGGDKQNYVVRVKVYRYPKDFAESSLAPVRRAIDIEIDEDKLFLAPLESKPYGEFFTATQLQTFSLCPMKFYLKFRLGLPELKREIVFYEEFEDVTAPPYEDDFKDEIVGTVKGRIVHEVLERWKGEVNDEKLKEVVLFTIRQNGIANEKKAGALFEYVMGEVKRVLDSEFGKRVFSSDEHHAEYGISVKFGDGYLMGKIDRLYKVNGEWEIVDFKTDDIEAREIETKRKEYEVQLGVYAYLLSKLYPEQKVFRGYILFTKFPDLPVEVVHTQETLKEFEGEIAKMIETIKQMDLKLDTSISSDFKEHCYYCGYFNSDDRKCIGGRL